MGTWDNIGKFLDQALTGGSFTAGQESASVFSRPQTQRTNQVQNIKLASDINSSYDSKHLNILADRTYQSDSRQQRNFINSCLLCGGSGLFH